jgi:hypothetical protein
VSSSANVCLLWGHQLNQAAPASTPWLWHGLVAPGNVTLLTSAPKAGKTTLLALLLDRLRTGGTLAGLPVRPGKALVVSEEAPAHWQARRGPLTFAEQVCFVCRPFGRKPTGAQWRQLLDHLLALHGAHGFDLAVLDTLSAFLPAGCENRADGMLEALLPLQRVAERGLALLVQHHPPKREQAPGLSSRGSGALRGFADILLELRRLRGAGADDRRRHLLALSRHPETPAEQLRKLNATGTDYVPVKAAGPEGEFAAGWQALRLVLEDARGKVTRARIEEAWPSATTLWRWLERAAAEGRVCRSGSGRNADPFRYWLAEKEADFRAGAIPQLLDEDEELRRRLRGEL